MISNVSEVDRLVAIHQEVTGGGPGRKYDVGILNKSGIVLLVACWEAYVEDLADAALDFMIENAEDHTAFPANVLERVASLNTGLKAWQLAGDGWQTAMRNNYKAILGKTTGSLNTPRTAQVDELFKKTIGIPKLSASWRWHQRTVASSTKRLDDLVTLRCSIAHRVTAAKTVHKKHVTDGSVFLYRLATVSANSVRSFVHSQIAKNPWDQVFYGNVS